MRKLVECASVPCFLPEEQAFQVDEIAKSLPSGLTYQRKSMQVEYQFEPGERAEVSVLTKAEVDKSNEVVLPEGLDLEPYRKSGIVLWEHDKDRKVATCQWIKLFHGAIRAKTIYPERPPEYDGPWFTDEVWALTRCEPPILRCKSIGFLPLVPLRDPTREELELHPEWQGAGIWEKSLLLEYSCVYTGCLDDALVEVVNTKSLDALKVLGVAVPEKKSGSRTWVNGADPCPDCEGLHGVTKEAGEVFTTASGKSVMEPPAHPNCKCSVEYGNTINPTETKISKDEAVAYALQHAVKKKSKKKMKKVDWDAIMVKAISQIDPQKIVQEAMENYKNRNRV